MEYVSLAAYFAIEDEEETKSEYFDGVIVPMPGFSIEHICITSDLIGIIHGQLKGRACQGFCSPLRVYSEARNTVMYPDLTVACDAQVWWKTRYATLTNPTLIMEVYSDSTEANDRSAKFVCYQTLPSLQTYVLIAENKSQVEVFTRDPDGLWRHEKFTGLDTVVPLPSVGCELPLADVYERIAFLPQLRDTGNAGSSEPG